MPTHPADFADRTVVLTGGTGALGLGVASELLDRGARLAIPVFDTSELDRFPHAADDRVSIREGVDLTDERAVESFYQSVDGPLWASIHIAGGFDMGPLADFDGDRFDKLMRLNARTCYLCCRAAALAIRRAGPGQGGGRIVNVAARNAVFPELGGGLAAYAASKAAVAALSQALGAELAGDGIWVNAVAPSTIDTLANRSAMPDADHDAWPTPAEIARTIAFLASPMNETTRSAVVPVYGRS
ncbi:MAG: SDR family NAD(P)-dependent oxidoreductase [Planctomycetota bacterium]